MGRVFSVLVWHRGGGSLEVLFQSADPLQRFAGRGFPELFGQLFDEPFHDRQLVGVVKDGERLRTVEALDFAAQQEQAEGVERADPRGQSIGFEAFGDARAHLCGGAVCEGDGEDVSRIDAAFADEPDDAFDDDAGLAGTGAGEHEGRAVGGGSGVALGLVEVLESGVHGVNVARADCRGGRVFWGTFWPIMTCFDLFWVGFGSF